MIGRKTGVIMNIFLLAVTFLISGMISTIIFFKVSNIKASLLLKGLFALIFGFITFSYQLFIHWIEIGDSNSIDAVVTSLLTDFQSIASYIIHILLLSIFLPTAIAYLYRIAFFIIRKSDLPKLTLNISGGISIVISAVFAINLILPVISYLGLIDETYNQLIDLVEYQTSVDAKLQTIAENNTYTAESPYVELNPYSNSPLTGIIIFSTDEDCYIEVSIDDGLYEKSGDSHTFELLTTSHIIPVYGLYADTANQIEYTLYSADDEIISVHTATIQTEKLPSPYDDLIITANTISYNYTEGLNFLYSDDRTYQNKIAFDQNGEIRWMLTDIIFGQVSEVYNDRFFLNTIDDNYIVEIDKMGKIHTIHDLEYFIHHDIEAMDNGNLLIASNNTVDSSEDFIFEIDSVTGEVVNTLDLREVLSRSRFSYSFYADNFTRDNLDWFHLNSIEYIASDECIIISGNFQSTVAKISWPEGEIQWILADEYDWMSYYEQFLLEPIGDNFEHHYNQHAAYLLPDLDNNPDTIDITLFDNGFSREYISENYHGIDWSGEYYSRIVHYRINEVTMEVEQIFDYGKERGEELYSQIRSDADYLESTGNYLGMFDRWQPQNLTSYATYPAFIEVNSNGDVVWEAELFAPSSNGAIESYQADRLPAYFPDEEYLDIYSTARILVS